MAALLRIIHPAQFFQCFGLSKQIAESVPINHRQTVLDLLEFWASPFHCMQVIVNRETINHRDTRGWALGYDLLATFGNYNNGVLSLPTIVLECLYNPGTVTGLMGKVFIHGVRQQKGLLQDGFPLREGLILGDLVTTQEVVGDRALVQDAVRCAAI